jgi:cadmium resistance protein CadD (predicted permease)
VLGTLAIALAAFASTNIDDLLILSVFFANRRFHPWQVVVGQYMGLGALVGLSVLGGVAIQWFPEHVTRWLGILPILIGVKWLVDRLRQTEERHFKLESEPQQAWAITSVALVTIANGGDNIAVYVPLFAKMQPTNLTVTMMVFILMTAVWCAISYWLVRNPLIGRRFTIVGQWAAPFVLIGVGFGIVLALL